MSSDLININATTASLSVSTTSAAVALDGGYDSVLVDNTLPGNTDCYVRSGLSTVAATTSHMHIAAGEKASYRIDPSHTHVAAITSSGTTTLRLTRGSGE